MLKEEEHFIKRIHDLEKLSFHRGYPTYTDFLNLNELNIFYSIKNEFQRVPFQLWGGYQHAERCILCFPGDWEKEKLDFGISCVKISAINTKFSDHLTHRDYLGAILNLGIERSKIGDILIQRNIGYVFCKNSIAEFIIQNLYVIKHTSVHCIISSDTEFDFTQQYKEINGSISSVRLDAIIALALSLSRTSVSTLISSRKVFVNNRLVLSNSCQLKDGDIVSVRGYGKFLFQGITNQTRKGRYVATILRYV